MITKFLNVTLSRLLGIGALLLASTAMGQFTVNDGSARGTCSSFTFAGGVLALSPSGCLGTVTQVGPVFSFSATNLATISEGYALGVVNKALSPQLSVHLERAGNTSPLNVDVIVCAAGTNCTAVGGQDYQLDGSFAGPPWTKTLTFGPTETDKTFDIYLVDDLVSDGNKILTFKLSNPTTPAGISGDTSSLTIIDNEVAPSTTVSFGFGAYQISEGNPDGKAALAIIRSAAVGAASVQVEVAAAGTTAVVGTHYNINDPATPFAGTPPTYTASFVDGQATAYIFIPTINNTIADGNKVVALNLKNPSALSLGTPASATLTILDNDSGGTSDPTLDGLPMAKVTIDTLVIGSNNFCAFGRYPGGNVGPCGASPVPVGTCGTGIGGGGVTNAWELEMVDASGALTYMPFRFHSVHMTMAKGHAMSWKFHTPPASQIPSIIVGGFAQTTTTIGAEAPTFMSVSTSRCDFDYSKVNTVNACYRSLGGIGNGVDTRLSPAGTPPDALYCDLQPDTTYYLNYRWELAAAGPSRGVEACSAPNGVYTQCGMAIDFR